MSTANSDGTSDPKSTPQAQGTPGPAESKPGEPDPCTCYCFVNWIAPIAAPHVPKLPNTVVTTLFALPPFQTETETGEEFWTANVNKKDYHCVTKVVLATTPDTPNLVHNTYSRSRTRNFGLGWGPWTAWSPFANTGNYTNAQALATSAPPMLPECTAVGVACP